MENETGSGVWQGTSSIDYLRDNCTPYTKVDETNPKDLLGDKKIALSQVSPVALIHEAMAMMDGTYKYGFRNYREKKVQARIYIDAALRHIQAWAEKEELAEDSGVHHLGHARACLGILLDAQENGNLIDNRVPGVFTKVMNKMEQWVTNRKKHYEEKANKNLTGVPLATATCTCKSCRTVGKWGTNGMGPFSFRKS